MPDAISPSAAAAPATPFDPNLVYTILVEEPRRRMLLALAGGQPLSADALGGAAGRTRGATLKHLALLSQAGLVLARPDPSDGRRMLYALAPSVPVAKSATGWEIDFGFCLLRL